AVHTQPTLSPGLSARVTEAMTLSPPSFRKRYGSSYETPSSSASPASSLTFPLRKTYQDPKDNTVYMDIKCDMPPVHLPA
ncbi:hypothetical protein Tco_0482754, partial [Tanacetum coccineum]